jgi:hypothetical protein
MNAPFETPPVADFLSQAIEAVREQLERAQPNRERARIFWAAIVCSRDLGAADVVADDFRSLAIDTRLAAELGRETIGHLIKWGLLNRDPFGDRRT